MQIEAILISKAQGTFLWVSLVLRLLEQRRFLMQTDLQMIQSLPYDLVALYNSFLDEIPVTNRSFAGHILRIIAYSKKPLDIDEISMVSMGGQLDFATYDAQKFGLSISF